MTLTEFAYDIQDATMAQIRELINRTEIENNRILGNSTFTGNGETTSWYVAPPGFYIYEDSFSVTVDGVAASHTLDSVTGIVTMNSVPADGSLGVCSFQAQAFPDFQVDAAINSAIQLLFPAFYLTDNEIVACDGDTYEFTMPESVEVVTSVDYRSGTSGGWSRQDRRRRFTVEKDGDSIVIRFYTAPSSGYLRFHTVSRPGLFTYEDQPLSALGLPGRAAQAIIPAAVYQLLMAKSAVRIRTDVAVATMGTGTVFPSMMSSVASNWLMRYQFVLNSIRMKPWMIR